jgi:hypothetical protein
MVGGGHVHDASPVMPEHDEHEQEPEGDARHDEQVGGHDLTAVVGQERSPRL